MNIKKVASVPALAGDKLRNSAIISAAALGIVEIVAHIKHLSIPMLDQAFIAAIGVLFAPTGDKEESGNEKA